MTEHPIQGLMTTAMENLKDMVEVNTIIGEPVESHDGTIIIPVSKVGFGFAAGGSEFSGHDNGSGHDEDSSSLPFGGGSGGGVSITPVAFLIMGKHGIKMVHLDQSTHIYEKMIDAAPQAVEKIQQILKESKWNNQQEDKPQRLRKEKDRERERESSYRRRSDDDDDEYSDYRL